MSEAIPEIVDQPQLSFMDGSNQEAVRFFDTMAIKFPDAVQSAAERSDLAAGAVITHPESFLPADAEGIKTYQQEQAAAALSELLSKSGGGRFLEYDGPTWVAVLADSAYHRASEKVQQARESSPTLASDRRTVALRGLAIYAQRRYAFDVQAHDSQHASVSDIRFGMPQQAIPQTHPGAA